MGALRTPKVRAAHCTDTVAQCPRQPALGVRRACGISGLQVEMQ